MAGSKPGERRGGRKKGVPNKANRELKEIAGEYTDRALEVLADIMENGESEQARVSAADKLLDRAHGKPSQTQVIAGDKNNPLELFIGFRDGIRSKLARITEPRSA